MTDAPALRRVATSCTAARVIPDNKDFCASLCAEEIKDFLLPPLCTDCTDPAGDGASAGLLLTRRRGGCSGVALVISWETDRDRGAGFALDSPTGLESSLRPRPGAPRLAAGRGSSSPAEPLLCLRFF